MSDTRQRMIETAVSLFQKSGYHATSWRTLVEAAGTPWGSQHHHFPGGKEELGVAAVALGGGGVADAIDRTFAQAGSAAEAIRAWCRLNAELLEKSGFVRGCPIATVALEASADSEALRAAVKKTFERWKRLLAKHLRAEGIEGGRAAELATLSLLTLEGALLLARVQRSREPLLLAGEHLARAIEAEEGRR